MAKSASLHLEPRAGVHLKQLQRLIMSPQMQQAIHMLQMPIMELATRIELEIGQNPLLEFQEDQASDDPEMTPLEREVRELPEDSDYNSEQELSFNDENFEILQKLDREFRDLFTEGGQVHRERSSEEDKLKSFQEHSISAQSSLFEHLMQQVQESFDYEEDRKMAEAIIGNLNSQGFLFTPLQEIATLNHFSKENLQKVLVEIQTFTPFGVGARNLAECFLIQLRCQRKQQTLAYKVLAQHYEDLLHNRIPAIQKGLNCSLEEINHAIEEIAKLDFHPGSNYSREITQTIAPDVTLSLQEDDQLVAEVNDEFIPSIRFNRRYLRMLEDPSVGMEVKEFIKNKISSAKWLFRNLSQRNSTIHRIAEFLAAKQKEFFLQLDGKLIPLVMKELAEELDLHESTIARAISNKYIQTPRGIFPLKYFFSNAYSTEQGEEISSKTVREVLKDLIDQEEKQHPLSDEALSRLLKEKGIPCARRTVAKYRQELQLGNAKQRRKY